ncbi:PKD domain-containing protein [Chitinispirillales bacterium ANBcel5]|uniref:PKD domain-containing protein n=1 Tax=Cellulosispirillum alkaliphilum TaxID=3039283 RepID=UPI002A57627A|nr:PKD domain-containing protein [Chitinispirillales bacterium ANBcel5]
MKKPSNAFGLSLCFISILLSCSLFEARFLQVQVVIGDVTLIRSGTENEPFSSQWLKENDTLMLKQEAKIKIESTEGSVLYLNGPAIVAIGEHETGKLNLHLSEGELYATSPDSAEAIYCKTDDLALRAEEADFSLFTETETKKSSLTVLSGTLSIESRQRGSLGACSTVVFYMGTDLSSQSITSDEIEHLKRWVGEKTVSSSLKECFFATTEEHNQPPQWVTKPVKSITQGEQLRDTLLAKSISGEEVTYSILEGPQGMKIGPENGVLTFKPQEPGAFSVKLAAEEENGLSNHIEYTLRVKESEEDATATGVNLSMPSVAQRNDRVKISASPVPEGLDVSNYQFRFDTNGDGAFDMPHGGDFGSESSFEKTFENEGEVRITVEMAGDEGLTYTAHNSIMINKPPVASLKITPKTGRVGTEFTFDAGNSSRTGEQLVARWDLNGDGSWDYPVEGDFSDRLEVTRTFKTPGLHRVTVEVRDRNGITDSATAAISIDPPLSIKEIEGPDSAYAGQNIQFRCVVSQAGNDIENYKWIFSSDTVNIEKATENPELELLLPYAGEYSVECFVLSYTGEQVSQQTQIQIVNTPAEISAGGPYNGRVHHPVTFKGDVQTTFGEIVSVYWDFDGNGENDFSGTDGTVAEHIFSSSGDYKAVFSAELSDGSLLSDTALVSIAHRPPQADAGEDVTSRSGRRVRLRGNATKTDAPIEKYEWDFDGNGDFDWYSKESGEVVHRFQEYSRAVFKVTDIYGAVALDTVLIVICPDDMELVEEGKYCIDRYEWPNTRGTLPEVGMTYKQASDACEEIGKRLCTPVEWETACNSANQRQAYPYGRRYDVDRCNTLGNPRSENELAPSGYFRDCVGRAGVFDMSGNAAEWTASEDNYEAAVYGGFYQSGQRDSRCDSKLKLKKDQSYFYTGFRCCK